MKDFQSESLKIAERIVLFRESARPADIQRLYKAFTSSFLHYSRKTPDHWRHPRNTWSGSPDFPSTGSCVCLAILASGHDPEEMVLRYHEFLGAMASRLSPEEAAFAVLSIRAAKKIYPEDPRFVQLEEYLRKKGKAPASESYARANSIVNELALTEA